MMLVSVLLGMLGFLLGWVLFYAGYRAGRDLTTPSAAEEAPKSIPQQPSSDEEAALEKERERLREDQRAFHDLLGYNADVAYGKQTMPGKE